MSWFVGRHKIRDLTRTSHSIKNTKLGSFGEILFEVSSNKIETISNYSREIKSRLSTHEVIGNKPIVEYLSSDLQSIKFKMQFSASLGINPQVEIEKLVEMCEHGEVYNLIIGNTVIGKNKWIIESISETEDIWTPEGRLLYSEVEVSLKEYV